MHISVLKYLNFYNVCGSYYIVGVQSLLFPDYMKSVLLSVVHAGLCPKAMLFSCVSGVFISLWSLAMCDLVHIFCLHVNHLSHRPLYASALVQQAGYSTVC